MLAQPVFARWAACGQRCQHDASVDLYIAIKCDDMLYIECGTLRFPAIDGVRYEASPKQPQSPDHFQPACRRTSLKMAGDLH